MTEIPTTDIGPVPAEEPGTEPQVPAAAQPAAESQEPVADEPGVAPADDRVVRGLAWAAYGIVIVIVTLTVWVYVAGIAVPQVPRTALERELFMLEKVTAERPGSARAWADYAYALIVAERYAAAERVLDEATENVGDQSPELLIQRGRLAAAQGDADTAVDFWQRTIDAVDTFRADELKRLAEKGIVPDKRSVKGDVKAAAARLAGDAKAKAGEPQDAIDYYTISLTEEGGDADVYVARGQQHLKLGETVKARSDFKRALVLVPGMQSAKDGLAEVGE